MSTSRSFVRRAAVAVLVLGSALGGLSASARAEDAPAAPPKPPAPPPPPAKVAGAFPDFLVGAWTIAGKAGPVEMKGVSSWSKACEGAVLVEELRTGEGETSFYGLGVTTLADDGKTLTSTWFDTDGGADAWVFTGTLAADGWELEGEHGGGKVGLTFRKQDAGAVLRMHAGGETMFELTYTKAATATADLGAHPSKAVKHPFVDAMLGGWDYTGSFDTGGQKLDYTGEISWRAACGGSAFVGAHRTEMGAMGIDHGFMVARVDVGAKVMKVWGWSSTHPAGRMEGPLTDTRWDAATVGPSPFGDAKMTMTKTDAGFSATIDMAGMKGTETHTKKK